MGLRAGLYERVSILRPGDKDARSVREQNAAGERACKDNGWTVTERYADPGVSASRFARKHREEWERLVRDASAGHLDVIVMWEPSRGSRELEEWARFLNTCRNRHILLHITSHERTYDFARGGDWKALASEGVTSADESDKTSLRVRRALKASAQAGRPHGVTLFGYERIYDERTKELLRQQPHPVNAPIVREVIERIAGGEPATVIARDMTLRGVATPNHGQWNPALVRRIALNVAYIGKRRHYDEQIDAMWPPLVELAVFTDARRILTDPSRSVTRPGGARHLLSYFATCGVCGGLLSAAVPASHQGRQSMYACRTGGHVGIREDWLDRFVLGLVAFRLDSPAFWEAVLRDGDDTVRQAQAEGDELRGRLAEYRQAAVTGKITLDSFAMFERELTAGIAAADERAAAVSLPPTLRGLRRGSGTIAESFLGEPVAVQKATIRALFLKIEVHRSVQRGRRGKFDPSRITWEWREIGGN